MFKVLRYSKYHVLKFLLSINKNTQIIDSKYQLLFFEGFAPHPSTIMCYATPPFDDRRQLFHIQFDTSHLKQF